MNKKITGTIICLTLLIISALPVYGTDVPFDSEYDKKTIEELVTIMEKNDIEIGEQIAYITGPVLKLFSKVELLDGNETQMQEIRNLLDRKSSIKKRFLSVVPVFVENLSFTVEFKIPQKNNSRFSYRSVDVGGLVINFSAGIGNIINLSYYNLTENIPHKIEVKNLTGVFIFEKLELIQRIFSIGRLFFEPARFRFAGYVGEVIYHPIAI